MDARWRWPIAVAVLWAIGGAVALGAPLQREPHSPGYDVRLHVFFSPEAPPDETSIKRLRDMLATCRNIRLDLILLIQDFAALRQEPAAKFQSALKSLRDLVGPDFGLSLHDEHGLALAKSFGLTRLPAWVLDDSKHAHIAYGSNPNLEALLACGK